MDATKIDYESQLGRSILQLLIVSNMFDNLSDNFVVLFRQLYTGNMICNSVQFIRQYPGNDKPFYIEYIS